MVRRLRKLNPCAPGGTINEPDKIIHQVADPARAVAHVRCDPTRAHGYGELLMTKVTAPAVKYQLGPQSDPWEHEIETGLYNIEVTFSDGQYQNTVEALQIVPPLYFECPIKVS